MASYKPDSTGYPPHVTRFLKWLKVHPDCTKLAAELECPSFYSYLGSLSKAKAMVGIRHEHIRKQGGCTIYTPSRLRQLKDELIYLLERNPDTKYDALKPGHVVVLDKYYGGSINALRRSLGITLPRYRMIDRIRKSQAGEPIAGVFEI